MQMEPHLRQRRTKTMQLLFALLRVRPASSAEKSKFLRQIYLGAIEPYLLCGYGAWGDRLHFKQTVKILESVQRLSLVLMTGSYRTVSTQALQILAGVMPLNLKAMTQYARLEVCNFGKVSHMGDVSFHPSLNPEKSIWETHPTQWMGLPFDKALPLDNGI